MICDISKHQGAVDWDRLAPELDFVVIKAAGLYRNGADMQYAANVREAVAHGVPWHAYAFLYSMTEAEAKRDAWLFYETVKAQGHWPLFWVLDMEGGWGAKDRDVPKLAAVFEDKLRWLARENGPGEIRVAAYVAQEKYYDWALDYGHYAYIWIPGYGEKNRPKMACDLWQYTSSGTAPGISGRVDLNVLTGRKPLSYFTDRGESEAARDEDSIGGDGGMLTGKQLAAYCEKVYKAGWVYWYGTYGKKCSQSLYEAKKKQYPSHYTAARAAAYKKDIAAGKRCADCVGMIKSFFWTGGQFDTEPKYGTHGCPDKSANGMIEMCVQTGPIKSIPDEPGLVVWKSGHIGVYVGNGYTVEMKGFDYDCKRNKVSAGPWVKWGRLPGSMISYDDDACDDCVIPPEPEGDRALRNGDEGADVKQLQMNLIQLGFSCGKWGADGEFGDCTEQAVEAFQRAHGLDVTGVYDAATREVMEKELDADDEPAEQPRDVKIVGGNCYVRSAPNTGGRKLGVAHEGDVLPWQGQTSAEGWQLVEYKNQNGWVSGKYGKLV